jgi:hypothetical protein
VKRNPFARLRARRTHLPAPELALAAMVDMMINLLIFLLHLYGRDPLTVPLSDEMQLPRSASEDAAVVARIPVVVSTKTIWVGTSPVLSLAVVDGRPALPDGAVADGAVDALIAPLRDALANARSSERTDAPAELVVQADRRVPWAVLGPVIRSGALAGADRYRFLAHSGGDAEP